MKLNNNRGLAEPLFRGSPSTHAAAKCGAAESTARCMVVATQRSMPQSEQKAVDSPNPKQ